MEVALFFVVKGGNEKVQGGERVLPTVQVSLLPALISHKRQERFIISIISFFKGLNVVGAHGGWIL